MSVFHREDAEAICRIPLSRRNVSDSIIWLHNINGMFTVKSTYKVPRKIQSDGDWAKNTSRCAGKKVWAVLWKLLLLNKIKVFGWRACHDILPTCVNLTKRRIIDDNGCPICTRVSESTIHALWDCAAAQDIWAGSIKKLHKGCLHKGCRGQSDMLHLMEYLLD